jgi:hypothetical protein
VPIGTLSTSLSVFRHVSLGYVSTCHQEAHELHQLVFVNTCREMYQLIGRLYISACPIPHSAYKHLLNSYSASLGAFYIEVCHFVLDCSPIVFINTFRHFRGMYPPTAPSPPPTENWTICEIGMGWHDGAHEHPRALSSTYRCFTHRSFPIIWACSPTSVMEQFS